MAEMNLDFLKALSRATLLAISLVLIVAIGFVDYVTGYDLSVGLFYIAPISLLSWYVSRREGIVAASGSAVVWFFVNSLFAPPDLSQTVLLWNSAIRFGFFLIIAILLASLKSSYDLQSNLARMDPLTGLLNSRAFLDEAKLELVRAVRNRYDVAVLYIDLDNFKALNDSKGHAAGDSLLRDIGIELRNSLRVIDLAGRVGGDEFAIILSGVSIKSAQATASRLQSSIHNATLRLTPHVTASIGIVNSDGTEDIEILIAQADHLMYQGKAISKGSIQLSLECDDA